MKLQIDTDDFKPSTLAAMIADLQQYPTLNERLIKALMDVLEFNAGTEESIDFLAEAGAYPGDTADEWEKAKWNRIKA